MSTGRGAGAPFALDGDLTVLEAAGTRTRLLAALDAALADGTDLVLDLSEVEETDTAGLQLLLALVRDAAATGVRVRVQALSPAVAEMLALVHLGEDLRPVPRAVTA